MTIPTFDAVDIAKAITRFGILKAYAFWKTKAKKDLSILKIKMGENVNCYDAYVDALWSKTIVTILDDTTNDEIINLIRFFAYDDELTLSQSSVDWAKKSAAERLPILSDCHLVYHSEYGDDDQMLMG
jgi:hypothetical protein